MIFYFSGTGNSQFVANEIARIIDDELVSINESIKSQKTTSFKSEEPLVFVLPTYAWRLPKIVQDWIKTSSFSGNKESYFVLTCGGDVGSAASYAKDLCKERGLKFKGLSGLLMPENYLALFSTPDADQAQLIVDRARPHIEELAQLIKNKQDFPQKIISLRDRILSGSINLLFYPFIVKDKGFTVSDSCISCTLCSKVCPLNNVKMEKGKPQWLGNCTHCMACIACCPVEAIEYKKASKGRPRHYIRDKGGLL